MKYDDIEQLKELVRTAKIRMMTIDSNIIAECGYRFDKGLLGQLCIFKNSRFKFLLSEIVIREIKRQIAERNSTHLQGWPKISDLLKSFSQTTKATMRLEDCVSKLNHQAIAEWQINQFLIDTAAEVVSTDHAEMEHVLDLYFDRRSPFGKAGKKVSFQMQLHY